MIIILTTVTTYFQSNQTVQQPPMASKCSAVRYSTVSPEKVTNCKNIRVRKYKPNLHKITIFVTYRTRFKTHV